jgi:hypothetical protein
MVCTDNPGTAAQREWVWQLEALPEMKLYLLALLDEPDPERASEMASLRQGQGELFQDMAASAGWAVRDGGGFRLVSPQEREAMWWLGRDGQPLAPERLEASIRPYNVSSFRGHVHVQGEDEYGATAGIYQTEPQRTKGNARRLLEEALWQANHASGLNYAGITWINPF